MMNPDPTPPFSAAAERNKGPILQLLESVLAPAAAVLEIASGTGQHAAHFAAAHPRWHWQPSEADAALLPAIAAWCNGLPNVAPPLVLDLLAPDLPASLGSFDAVFVANLLHISPWPTCEALMRLAAARIEPGGALVVYGPFRVEGEPLAPSNVAFDEDLRSRDPRWGLRLVGDVDAQAARAGLVFERRVAMPANNLTVLWRRAVHGVRG
jgi:SAM-dependent methyltransferase